MVTPLYNDEIMAELTPEALIDTFDPFVKRLHSVVIGPGMGRDPKLLAALPALVNKIKDAQIPYEYNPYISFI